MSVKEQAQSENLSIEKLFVSYVLLDNRESILDSFMSNKQTQLLCGTVTEKEWIAEQASEEKLPKTCTLLVTPHCMHELNYDTCPTVCFVCNPEPANEVFLQVFNSPPEDRRIKGVNSLPMQPWGKLCPVSVSNQPSQGINTAENPADLYHVYNKVKWSNVRLNLMFYDKTEYVLISVSAFQVFVFGEEGCGEVRNLFLRTNIAVTGPRPKRCRTFLMRNQAKCVWHRNPGGISSDVDISTICSLPFGRVVSTGLELNEQII
ncbi:hypothetical protein DUI87_08553 [Hirundo rustica rustica]|uniref:Uncharacterized protein n=1 Tax=Hirundo rustica rustica TaxID=333673 RepID=A0A3M0KRX8_HIRRU|nr:hypothetical protein DUI87_08553 [Hirundo rustica rustica]